MRRTTMGARARLAALWLALFCLPLQHTAAADAAAGSSAASPRSVDVPESLVTNAAGALVEWTRKQFDLSADLPFDADVRHRMALLVDGFAERQRPLYQRWARALIDSPDGREDMLKAVNRGMGPRAYASLADWRLRSAGPAHEALLREAAMKPAECRAINGATTVLDEIAALLQATPPVQRDAFMEGERQLLARWGEPPPALADTDEEPQRDIARWALALRRGEAPDTLPMAPLLAGEMTAEPPRNVYQAGRCAARQWWLANRLRRAPGASENIWRAWHLAFARDLMDLQNWTPPYLTATGPIDYPLSARQMGLHGTVRVSVERDGHGHFRSGEVTARRLVSELLPGRPVPMFEDFLDAPSLARARQLTNEQAAAASAGASAATSGNGSFEFSWEMKQ